MVTSPGSAPDPVAPESPGTGSVAPPTDASPTSAGAADDDALRSRRGIASALGAFGWWGLMPLYLTLLAPAGALEISAHRVVWSLLFCLVVLAVIGGLRPFVAVLRRPHLVGRLAVGAVFLAVNWLIYVVAATTGHVVEASLGYFLNPLISSALAVVVLRERLRTPQWVALGIAGCGVVVMAVGLGTVPWIALGLAVSFGLYGLTKKQVGARVTAVSGLAVETGVMLLPAAGYLVWLTATGGGTFGADVGVGGRPGHALLLASAGVVSAVPLVLFAAGARRLSLASVAMTQFVTPVMQFAVGVLVLGEPMPASRWIGFGFVWLAVLVLLADLSRLRRGARPRAAGPG